LRIDDHGQSIVGNRQLDELDARLAARLDFRRLMSISPRQNFWKPPPVPEMPTVIATPLFAR